MFAINLVLQWVAESGRMTMNSQRDWRDQCLGELLKRTDQR